MEAIGILASILFIIWILDLIFWKKEREERLRRHFDKKAKFDRQLEENKMADYYVCRLLNNGNNREEARSKLSIKYDFLDEDYRNSLIDKYYNDFPTS